MRPTKSVNAAKSEGQSGGATGTIIMVVAALGIVITLLTQTTWVSNTIMERTVDLEPDAEGAPRTQYRLGLYCFYLANGKHAREIFERLLAEYPDSEYAPLATYRIAQTWDEEGNRATAIPWFKKAVESLPEDHKFRAKAERKVRDLTTL